MLSILLICLAWSAYGDDYATLAQGLRDSSAKVNKMKFPELMYQLDEDTAHGYFKKYFSENRMTMALSVNLGYPLESWRDNHVNLQKALAPALIDEVAAFFAEHNTPPAISAKLSGDLALHDHLFYGLTRLSRIARSNKLAKEDMAVIGRRLFAVVKLSKLSDPRSTRIDQEKYPYVNSVKIQMLLACFSFAERGGNMTEFVRAARIGGPRGQLLAQTGVFAVDNGWFDARQLRGIKDYVSSLPPHLRFPIAVMCTGKSLSKQNKQVTVHRFKAVKAFNVFGTRVGARASNQFPKDYARDVKSDGFTIVLAHEYAHNVDSKYVRFHEGLNAFKTALLEKAGQDHNNYLRSMFKDGFFQKSKQEFIASLANQYFSSSQDMLRYALQKAKEGNYNQINQFVLMASIYSDSTKTYFYRIPENGSVKRKACPVKKTADGLVTHLAVGTKRYQFIYDGGVISQIEGI